MATNLLILGASVRAAAFSALRAGLQPFAIDLFADLDLQVHCPTIQVADYPHGFVSAAQQAPPGPWMFTGGLENRPELIETIRSQRPLWGNDASTLRRIRSPRFLAEVGAAAGVAFPEVHLDPPADRSRRWLTKPLAGAGGAGIRFWDGAIAPGSHFFQEFIEGDSLAAVFAGNGTAARLLGITRQLVGEPWLHAAPFHYCGSIGPLAVDEPLARAMHHAGQVLTSAVKLRGLFGIDCIVRDGKVWLIEVNPRYTASVEVVEFGGRISALQLHRATFEQPPNRLEVGRDVAVCGENGNRGGPAIVGKAILFARENVALPDQGPWTAAIGTSPDQLPTFADIPLAGQRIRAGRPILTFFATAETEEGCRKNLQKTAQELDRCLFGA